MFRIVSSLKPGFPLKKLAGFNAIRSYTKYPLNEQIYIHENGQNHFKFTLSNNPQSLAIGYSNQEQIVKPNAFQVNEEFVKVLHEQIGKFVQDDFSFIIEAGTNANSYMPIYDFREVPRYGRIPEVDNIFGYVMVDGNAKIVPGTYESNNLYRLCNGAGLIKLSDHLYEKLQYETEKHHLK